MVNNILKLTQSQSYIYLIQMYCKLILTGVFACVRHTHKCPHLLFFLYYSH